MDNIESTATLDGPYSHIIQSQCKGYVVECLYGKAVEFTMISRAHPSIASHFSANGCVFAVDPCVAISIRYR